jgi:hypothetical protein
LSAFFEPVSSATQRNSGPWASAGRSVLIALLLLILVRSLATPDSACAAITYATEAARAQLGASADSIPSAAICSARPQERHPHAEARRDPPAEQVGDDAEQLVEQEQERELDRRVAEAVEVQQHQHPQRAVGQRERPVGGGHDDVVAHRAHGQRTAPTLRASSAMRCT